MRTVKETRKFGGKTYKLREWFTYKSAASAARDTLKRRGHLARLTLRPKSKRLGGYPLCDLHYLWVR